jgi:hypothetical protein
MADGIGFRYLWATEGIKESRLSFKPNSDCMSLGELLAHVLELLTWVAENVGITPRYDLLKSGDFGVICRRTQELAAELSARFKQMGDEEVAACTIKTSRGETLPVWHMVNGPLSDSLTHIGQILSWRRIAGFPAAQADVFRGLAPRGT